MRVLLVMPTPFENGRLGLENVVWLSEPVALTAIGAAVGDRHEVRLLDMRLEEESALAATLSGFAPDVVGTTSMTTDAYQAKAVLRMARAIRPEALTVVGGHHPTLCPGEFDEPYVDVVVQGEGEFTFRELVERWAVQQSSGDRTFEGVRGVRFRDAAGVRIAAPKREQTGNLDDLPVPDRKLVAQYAGRYFFTGVRPMASIFTSRGCSFDCNFCAIWEFYERRTRFLSASRIVDQMAACKEPFVFILDDNFLTSAKRATELCEELERRGVAQVLDDAGTDGFRRRPSRAHGAPGPQRARDGPLRLRVERRRQSRRAPEEEHVVQEQARQRDHARPWDLRDGHLHGPGRLDGRRLRAPLRVRPHLSVAIPLFTVLTPLPGTQLHRAYRDKLLTTDLRLFDLLHAVLPTRLPRDEFYRQLCRGYDATESSVRSAFRAMLARRSRFVAKILPGMLWFYARTWRYQRVHYDYRSFLRDEEGLLDGPGAKSGLTWRDVEYPTGEAGGPIRAPEPGHPGAPPHSASLVGRRSGRGAGGGRRRRTMIRRSAFLADLRREIESHPAVDHLLLARLATSPFSREDYRVFGENHFPLVCVFTSYLERLLVRAPASDAKLWLAKVLVDEYGEGSRGEDHATLYGRFLRECGSSLERAAGVRVPSAANLFIAEHRRIVREEPFLVGLGAVGPGHEWAIPKMFDAVIPGLRRAGFDEEAIAYFTLHVEQDGDHGAWLEEALALHATTPEAQAQVRRGALRSLEARGAFWDGVQSAIVRFRQPRAARPDGPVPRSIAGEIMLTAWDGSRVSSLVNRWAERIRQRALPTMAELLEQARS